MKLYELSDSKGFMNNNDNKANLRAASKATFDIS